jgi:hypothetical protein
MSYVTNEQKEWDLESKLIEEMWNNVDPITGDYIDPNGVVLDREAEELTDILEDKEGYLNEKENKIMRGDVWVSINENGEKVVNIDNGKFVSKKVIKPKVKYKIKEPK